MELDGISLEVDQLVQIGYGYPNKVKISAAAWDNVRSARSVVDEIVQSGQTVYGINTGFGNFSNVVIPAEQICELQENLIRSHAAGVGQPLSRNRTRMLLALRINVLSKGHSGVRPETLQQLLDALNANCLSFVPAQGTVGASGDLAPLSHLALGLMGEGKMWCPKSGLLGEAKEILAANNLRPLKLMAKEGLTLINGTQLIASLGAEAVYRARNILRVADISAALTLEALQASRTPFHPAIHKARPHVGQGLVAARMRTLLNFDGPKSEIGNSHAKCSRVQDAYTLRCIPQIHGICNDTVSFVEGILNTELNSATDNPMVFTGLTGPGFPLQRSQSNFVDRGSKAIIISGGNFHGEYPAKVLDFLAIGIHEISSAAERRTERLLNPSLSHLPAFLVAQGGLNSGFMIAHCTSAALVSESKTLCHPASVDSLSTSAAQEDHVSMGGFAARKCLQVVEHVETCVAIELLCAAQGIEFLRPLKTSELLEKVHAVVRSKVPTWSRDRYMAPAIQAVLELIRSGAIWAAVEESVDPQYSTPTPSAIVSHTSRL